MRAPGGTPHPAKPYPNSPSRDMEVFLGRLLTADGPGKFRGDSPVMAEVRPCGRGCPAGVSPSLLTLRVCCCPRRLETRSSNGCATRVRARPVVRHPPLCRPLQVNTCPGVVVPVRSIEELFDGRTIANVFSEM